MIVESENGFIFDENLEGKIAWHVWVEINFKDEISSRVFVSSDYVLLSFWLKYQYFLINFLRWEQTIFVLLFHGSDTANILKKIINIRSRVTDILKFIEKS
jgi:hypothetical protein